MRTGLILSVAAFLLFLSACDGEPTSPASSDEIQPVFSMDGEVLLEAVTLSVSLDKPRDVVKKTDNLKLQGDISGLVPGKTYIVRVQVFEDGGSTYSPPLLRSFQVVN